MAHDVFISYSSKDQKIVEGLSAYLEGNGIRCFVAYRDIPTGVVWAGAITEAIEDCKMMIVVFSEHFNQSDQVDREIGMCSEEKKPILTFKIQEAAFNPVKKYYLKNINWIDAFPNPEEYFGKLLESVIKLLPDSLPGKPIPVVNQPVTKPAECLLKIRPNITCEVWIDDEKITLANANQITKIPLNRGTFWLEFVSAENESDKYACEYTIVQSEELLSVNLAGKAQPKITKTTNYDCLKQLYNELAFDKPYTVEEIKKGFETILNKNGITSTPNAIATYIRTATVNNPNRHHNFVKSPHDKGLFYYPNESTKELQKFSLDIKDNPTIYWLGEDNKRKEIKLSELLKMKK